MNIRTDLQLPVGWSYIAEWVPNYDAILFCFRHNDRMNNLFFFQLSGIRMNKIKELSIRETQLEEKIINILLQIDELYLQLEV